MKVPNTLVSLPHASHNWGPCEKRSALFGARANPLWAILYSDFLTTKIADIGLVTVDSIRSLCARFVDKNRARGPKAFADQDFGQTPDGEPDKHPLWLSGQKPQAGEQEWLLQHCYDPYYDLALAKAQAFDGPGIILDVHDTAPKAIGRDEGGNKRWMPINGILCTNADRGQADVSVPEQRKLLTCSPRFARELQLELRKAYQAVGLDLDGPEMNTYEDPDNPHDECGHFANVMNTNRDGNLLSHLRHPVETAMMEFSTEPFFHDRNPNDPDMAKIRQLRDAIERALSQMAANLRTVNVGVQI